MKVRRANAAARAIACALGGASLVALGVGTFVACSSSSSGAKAADASTESTVGDSGSPEGSAADAPCVPYDASGLDEAAVAAGHQQAMMNRCQHCHQPPGGGGVSRSGATTTTSAREASWPTRRT